MAFVFQGRVAKAELGLVLICLQLVFWDGVQLGVVSATPAVESSHVRIHEAISVDLQLGHVHPCHRLAELPSFRSYMVDPGGMSFEVESLSQAQTHDGRNSRALQVELVIEVLGLGASALVKHFLFEELVVSWFAIVTQLGFIVYFLWTLLLLRIRVLFDFLVDIDICHGELGAVDVLVSRVLAAVGAHSLELRVFALLLLQIVDAQPADVVGAALSLEH